MKTDEQRLAVAAVKGERARDKVEALREYEAERLALLAKTTRLRALRLAREATPVTKPPAKLPAKKAKKSA